MCCSTGGISDRQEIGWLLYLCFDHANISKYSSCYLFCRSHGCEKRNSTYLSQLGTPVLGVLCYAVDSTDICSKPRWVNQLPAWHRGCSFFSICAGISMIPWLSSILKGIDSLTAFLLELSTPCLKFTTEADDLGGLIQPVSPQPIWANLPILSWSPNHLADQSMAYSTITLLHWE